MPLALRHVALALLTFVPTIWSQQAQSQESNPNDRPLIELLRVGEPLEPFQEYGKRVKADQTLMPLTSSLFGDQVSLYNGSTEFSQVDVSLPGNSAIPVQIGRRYKIEDQLGASRLYGFGEWDLDIPYIHGTFTASGGWRVEGPNPFKRCESGTPPVTVGTNFQLEEYWHGTFLHLPGEGDRELLKNTEPKVPDIGGVGPYPWITKDYFMVRCHGTVEGGNTVGDSFVVKTPAGLEYTFNHWVQRTTTTIKKPHISGNTSNLPRIKVYLLVTEIRDQFGNFAEFSYVGDKLQTIIANDGRKIVVSWVGNMITTVTATDVTPSQIIETTPLDRTWEYEYQVEPPGTNLGYAHGQLTSVTRGDHLWTFNHSGPLVAVPAQQPPQKEPAPHCPEPFISDSTPNYVLTMVHPSGASGRFEFEFKRHYRSESPTRCEDVIYPGHQYLLWSNFFDNWTLASKKISGGNIGGDMIWSYNYGNVDPYQLEDTCSLFPCQQEKVVTVTNPDGSRSEHTLGIAYNKNEGRLLKEQVYSDTTTSIAPYPYPSLGQLLRTTTYNYQSDASIGSQNFANVYGTSLVPNFDPISNKIRPVVTRMINQDARDFVLSNTNFDAFGRVTAATQSSTSIGHPAYFRNVGYTFWDDLDVWVLSQPASTSVNGTVSELNTYYPDTARLWTKSIFGRLDRTFTWHGDGTLDSVQDPINPPTFLSSYKRGIPRTITLPLTSSPTMTAVVDDHGGIRQVTDATGFTTKYDRDAVGRIKQIDYPDGDPDNWTNTTISYTKATPNEYGVTAGHWRRTETTGARVKETFYDALLRSVLEVSSATDNSASKRSVRRAFDYENRETFVSYPKDTLTNASNPSHNYLSVLATGTTKIYDDLGRVIRTSQISELPAPVTTTTQYLPGFRTTHYDGRGKLTTAAFQTFDAPTYDFPMEILAPETQTTTFTRDVFGKPLSMTRSGTYTPPTGPVENLSATRWFIYDGYHRLCTTDEPDAGISVVQYDAASNVLWRAKGQSPLQPSCNLQRVNATNVSQHYYDPMNRLLAIDHPTGTDDVGFTYFADGTMQTATTGTLSGTSPATWSGKTSEWTYTYNQRRLLESESLAIDGKTFLLNWNYNARGDSDTLVYPGGLSFGFNPNAYGEPRHASTYAATPGLHPYGYHPSGQIAKFTYGHTGNTTTREVTFNARQMPSRIYDNHGGVGVLDHTLTYDENGNVMSLLDGVSGALESRSMQYDDRNRLSEVDIAGPTVESYEYDALDSLRRSIVFGQERRFAYDPTTRRLDQQTLIGTPIVLDYDWNLRGELATRVRTGGKPQTVTYTFDRASRLTRVQDVADMRYVYDAHGHRVRSHDETSRDQYKTYHVYSRTGQYLYRDESAPPGPRTEFFHLGKTLVGERLGPSGGPYVTKYLHADHLGTPSVKTASNGIVDYRSRKAPYGAPYDGIWRDGPDFTGHVSDHMTQLVYMQQRYYDPQVGQFISPDPVQASAQSFNRYWYAENNPYSMVDPDGEHPYRLLAGGGVGAVVFGAKYAYEATEKGTFTWHGLAGSTGNGFLVGVTTAAGPGAAGAAGLTGLPALAVNLSIAQLAGSAGSVIDQMLHGEGAINIERVAIDGVANAAGVAFSQLLVATNIPASLASWTTLRGSPGLPIPSNRPATMFWTGQHPGIQSKDIIVEQAVQDTASVVVSETVVSLPGED